MNIEKFLSKILELYKPQIDRWIVKAFVGTGLALITAGVTGISWWIAIALSIVKEELKKNYGTDLGITVIEWSTTIIGFLLSAVGLILYFLNKWFERKNQERPKLLIAIIHKSIDEFIKPNFSEIRNGYYEGYEIQTIIIDQTKTYKNGNLILPDSAIFDQESINSKISTLANTNSRYEIAYFGLAHIPLLFELGSQLADKFQIDFFEYDRHKYSWDYLNKKDFKTEIELNKINSELPSSNSVIKIEVSYPIDNRLIFEVVPDYFSLYTISTDPIQLDLIKSFNQIEEISIHFRKAVDTIIKEGPNIDKIHVFYSGPVSLAVNLGRKISKRTDPKFIVYNYMRQESPSYKWSIDINEVLITEKLKRN